MKHHYTCPKCSTIIVVGGRATSVGHKCSWNKNRWTEFVLAEDDSGESS